MIEKNSQNSDNAKNKQAEEQSALPHNIKKEALGPNTRR